MNPARPLHCLLLAASALSASVLPTPQAEAATAYQRQLLRFHNQERAKRNRAPLRLHGVLNRSSIRYAKLMGKQPGNYLSHTGPDGSTFVRRIQAAGSRSFQAMAENLALGHRSPRQVTKAWMSSPGHRRNILSARYRFVGFGRAGSGPHWVVNFGG